MSTKPNVTDDLEELSQLLDEMNVGHQPVCNNKETAQLLAIAALLKETGGHATPPQHLLDQTVDRALAGINASKHKKSRTWLYSGTAASAVAALLIFTLNLLPAWQSQISIEPQPPTLSQEQNNFQAKQETIEPPMTSRSLPSEPSTSVVDTILPTAKQQPSASAPPKQPLSPASAPAVDISQPQNTVQKSLLLTEQMPRLARSSKLAYLPVAETTLSESFSSAPTLTPLSLPNKTPDLIVADQKNERLKQVYNKGTSQEFTITQRPQLAKNNISQNKFQTSLITEVIEEQPPLINTIKVILFDQEITIEGRQSKEKLEQIAKSLTL